MKMFWLGALLLLLAALAIHWEPRKVVIGGEKTASSTKVCSMADFLASTPADCDRGDSRVIAQSPAVPISGAATSRSIDLLATGGRACFRWDGVSGQADPVPCKEGRLP